MSYTISPKITIMAGENLEPFRLIKFNGTSHVYADANDTPEAITMTRIASGSQGHAMLLNGGGEIELTAGGTITAGAIAYSGDDGKAMPTGSVPIGRSALTSSVTSGGTFPLRVAAALMAVAGLAASAPAVSTAITNTNVATDFDQTCTIPAGTLKAGDILRVRLCVNVTSGNSTNTLTLKLFAGSTELCASAAVDVTDGGDAGFIDVDLVVRTVGASGTFALGGIAVVGSTAKALVKASTAIDTTAAIVIKGQATWSATSLSNSCRQELLSVELLRKAA